MPPRLENKPPSRRMMVPLPRPPLAAPRLIEEEIAPPSAWIQHPEFHCLVVDVPGFKKDDIKIKVEESGSIAVSGRRKIGEEKQVHFEKSFNVPEDGDIQSISTRFEEDTLRVSVPKVAKEMKEEPEKTNGASSSDTKREDPEKFALTNDTKEEEEEKEKTESPASSSDTKEEQKEPVPNSKEEKTRHVDPAQGTESSSPPQKSSPTSPVIVKIIENKGILIASILSFTLGVLLSQKFHPSPPK